MESKRMFKVAVTELLRRTVLVEAESEAEARRRAEDAWKNGEILLGDRDFEGTEYFVLGETNSGDESEKHLERIEPKDV